MSGIDADSRGDPTPTAVVSVHDVRPDTLDDVAEILDDVRPLTGPRVALLVVPGLEWSAAQVDRLRGWRADGLELAGHGWLHRGSPRSLYHRLHGLLISRDQAEHLSRSGDEIAALMTSCAEWFVERQLGVPSLYVPPAWALGPIDRADLERLPFRWIEVLRGFIDVDSHSLLTCPLIGFEADTGLRRRALGTWNAVNVAWARGSRRPLRIGFHPRDLHLRLSDAARGSVRRGWRFLTTAEAAAELRDRS